jgi:hypothetical protein
MSGGRSTTIPFSTVVAVTLFGCSSGHHSAKGGHSVGVTSPLVAHSGELKACRCTSRTYIYSILIQIHCCYRIGVLDTVQSSYIVVYDMTEQLNRLVGL